MDWVTANQSRCNYCCSGLQIISPFGSQAQKCCTQRRRTIFVQETERCVGTNVLQMQAIDVENRFKTLAVSDQQLMFVLSRQRRRRKIKPMEKVETLKPSLHAAPGQSNGAVICNGVPITTNPKPLTKRLLQPTFRDSPPEGSSEGSSHSDDPSFCGITTACSRICDGLPLPKTRAEKRTLRRQHPKPSCAVMDLLQAPKRDRSEPLPISTIEDIMRKTEKSSGTFRVNVALSGPVWHKKKDSTRSSLSLTIKLFPKEDGY